VNLGLRFAVVIFLFRRFQKEPLRITGTGVYVPDDVPVTQPAVSAVEHLKQWIQPKKIIRTPHPCFISTSGMMQFFYASSASPVSHSKLTWTYLRPFYWLFSGSVWITWFPSVVFLHLIWKRSFGYKWHRFFMSWIQFLSMLWIVVDGRADKDSVMIRMVSGWMFLLVTAHPGSAEQTAVKR